MSSNSEDCLCGVCRSCRLAVKSAYGTPKSQPVSQLSELTLKILNEPRRTRLYLEEEFDPSARKEGDKVDEKKAATKKVSVKKATKPRAPAGSVSPEQQKINRRASKQRLRDQRKAERVMIDGYLTHPDAPHGEATGYNQFQCRCRLCMDSNKAESKARRERLAKERAT